MELYMEFITPGMTQSGAQRKFLGRSDEELMQNSVKQITKRKEQNYYKEVEIVFTSPLTRCIHTAKIIYPNTLAIVISDLTAFNYGDFEGKTFAMLKKSESFLHWISTNYLGNCPNGENPYAFEARCQLGFNNIVKEMQSKGIEKVAIVVTKEVLRNILQKTCTPRSYSSKWNGGFADVCQLKYDSISKFAVILPQY